MLFAWFVVAITVLLNRHSLWFDESYTILLVEPHNYGEIARRTSVDGHPPLFYWIVKPWLSTFGASAVALRAQQALFMVGAVALWFHFFTTRVSRGAALLALALMVTNPYMVHYAVEGRMYGLGTLLAAATTLLVTSSWRGRWYAYWPLAVAMLYTHYFLAFVLAGHFGWLLLARSRLELRTWWILLYGTSIVVAFVPWIPFALQQTQGLAERGFWIGPVKPTTFVEYALQTFVHVGDVDARGWFVFPTTALLVALAFVLVRAARTPLAHGALLWCLVAVPWLCLFVLSCPPLFPVFHPRYVLFSLPALLALVAAGLLAAPRYRAAAAAMIVVAQLVGVVMFWRGDAYGSRWYSMKRVAREVAKPVDGALPAVVVLGQMPFFDAKVTLRDQQVYELRPPGQPPQFGGTDAVYYDKPDWVVYDLASVKSRHVWFIESVHNGPHGFPAHWKELARLRRGYVQYRLAATGAP